MRRLLLFALLATPVLAQQSPSPVRAQHEAMTKLSFLVGNWSGTATVMEGPGTPLLLARSERVQPRLDGLILTLEGAATDPTGKIVFRAFATISYDDAAHQYRIRFYNDNGHYVDTQLSLLTDGFSWGYSAGQAHIVNTMHLTPAGEWEEKTVSNTGQNLPVTVAEMLLKRRE
jgi:hypothetical protein